ncbi:MAG TPA: DUF1697 domain-containing protein, partial [Gemmatimonadales bacterium]|nr:DUF1697 domain-containing protein [Gemmatimonadales bacterium]
RKLCEGLGLEDARTVLQSGNLVFRSGVRSARRMEQVLEAEAERRLALDTDIVVRSAAEWDEAVARNPLRREAERLPSRFIVMFLKDMPDRGAAGRLRAMVTGPEQAVLAGSQAYLVYPDGFARSRLTIARLEATLGTRATGRNWNTVLKLAGLVGR